ncbi:MAG: hypothetical protein ACRD2B_08975 [Terriglobia bacterium]
MIEIYRVSAPHVMFRIGSQRAVDARMTFVVDLFALSNAFAAVDSAIPERA